MDDTERSQQERDDYPHGARLAAVVAALGFSIFLVALDMTIVSTAIPAITDEFHSLSDVGWVRIGLPTALLRPGLIEIVVVVRVGVLSDNGCVSSPLGQGLQVLSSEGCIPVCNLHVRAGKPDLRYEFKSPRHIRLDHPPFAYMFKTLNPPKERVALADHAQVWPIPAQH